MFIFPCLSSGKPKTPLDRMCGWRTAHIGSSERILVLQTSIMWLCGKKTLAEPHQRGIKSKNEAETWDSMHDPLHLRVETVLLISLHLQTHDWLMGNLFHNKWGVQRTVELIKTFRIILKAIHIRQYVENGLNWNCCFSFT